MKDKQHASKELPKLQDAGEIKNNAEEFPVLDFSLPSGIEASEQADVEAEIKAKVAQLDQLRFIKIHIENLWREFDRLSENINILLQQRDKHYQGLKRCSHWSLMSAILALMTAGLVVGLFANQGFGLRSSVQDASLMSGYQDREMRTKFEQLQLQFDMMQAAQVHTEMLNKRLETSVFVLQQALMLLPKPVAEVTSVLPLASARTTSSTANVDSVAIPERAKWIVSLESFDNELDATKKALAYIAKDVTAIVSPTIVNGNTRYRIIVEGFKNKQESLLYAQKAKKRFNLESTWIARIK